MRVDGCLLISWASILRCWGSKPGAHATPKGELDPYHPLTSPLRAAGLGTGTACSGLLPPSSRDASAGVGPRGPLAEFEFTVR